MERKTINEVIAQVRKRIDEKKQYVKNRCVTQEFYADIDCYEQLAEWLEKFKQYKDAEEQGLLLRLPCPIGTTVYIIDRQFWIDSDGCKECVYYYNDTVEHSCGYDEDCPACTKVYEKKFDLDMLDEVGKTIFLTQAEAEQALEKMKAGAK